MKQLGADVIAVESGDMDTRAAIDEAMREWVSDPMDTYYTIGSRVGHSSLSIFGERVSIGHRH